MPVQRFIDEIGKIPGVKGCALVETGSGMVWHTAGALPDIERLGETASEYWRLHDRLSEHLATMGTPVVGLFAFSNGMLALEPCSKELKVLLVAIIDQQAMQWPAWTQKVSELKEALGKLTPS